MAKANAIALFGGIALVVSILFSPLPEANVPVDIAANDRSSSLIIDPSLEVASRRLQSRKYLQAIISDPKTVTSKLAAASCSQDGIPGLIEAMRSNINKNGLRPLSIHDEVGNELEHFLGFGEILMDAAFRGRKIFIYGDSTERNLNLWLHFLFSPEYLPKVPEERASLFSSLSRMDQSEANKELELHAHLKCKITPRNHALKCGSNGQPTTFLEDGTHIQFVTHKFCTRGLLESKEIEQLIQMRPQVVVANIGLWLFHFQNLGRSNDACAVESWVNYEEWFLERLTRVAEEAGVETLVFKTTNYICAAKYRGAYAKAAKHCSGREEKVLRGCFKNLRGKVPGTTSDADIANYCENGQFDDIGSEYLNARLVRFVEARRPTAAVRILLLNDHDIQSCASTDGGDARHHHTIQLARIRLLGNLLTCA